MPETPPPPSSPGARRILVGELAAALGTTRSSLLRAEKSKRIPAATERVRGSWRAWPVAVAASIVRAVGKPVPAAWGAQETSAASAA